MQAMETPVEDGNDKPANIVKKVRKEALKRKVHYEDQAKFKQRLGIIPLNVTINFFNIQAKKFKLESPLFGIENDNVKNNILDTSSWNDRLLKDLAKYMNNYCLIDVVKHSKNGGNIIILSESAIRACDLKRAISGLKLKCMKMISKNSIKKDSDLFIKHKPNVIIGTPIRVLKHLENDTFNKANIDYIIVDTFYLDKKLQSIWDTKETFLSITDIFKRFPNAKLMLY